MTIRSARLFAFASLALLAFVPSACRREETEGTPPVSSSPSGFRVTVVELGKAIDAGKRVSAPATSFAPSDTIYASIISEGAASQVALSTRWTYEDGQVVDESTQVIAPAGPAATAFHIAKPDGWPAGKYKLEVSANGAPVATKEFTVQ
jgi:hypothetical protein